MPPAYDVEVLKALLGLATAFLTLGATWFIGQRLTAYWNLRQKRNELNLASLQTFHSMYGEFKEVVKIWRLVKRQVKPPIEVPSDERWRLLVRACAIESKSEALVLRLTTERVLSKEATEKLGLFRQAMQTLRESISDDVECRLGSRGAEYRLLNELAPEIATLSSSELPKRPPTVREAQVQLAQVVAVTSRCWRDRVGLHSTGRNSEADEEDA